MDRPTVALTIWQPWASLIVHGLKPIEWRSWAAPRRFVGQRIAIHAGMVDPRKGIRHLLATRDAIDGSCGPGADVEAVKAALDRMASNPTAIPRGAVVGEATLGEPAAAPNLYERRGLKIGGEGPWMIGWPMLDPKAWDEPEPAKGLQGFWRLYQFGECPP